MRLKNILFLALGAVLTFGAASCDDDIDWGKRGTIDASVKVDGGVYVGTLTPADSTKGVFKGENITFELTRVANDSIQAVNVHITGTAKNIKTNADIVIDQNGTFNVATADKGYVFNSGRSVGSTGTAWKNSTGRLIGDELTFTVTMISSGKFSTASAAQRYEFVGKKQ